MKVIRAIAAKKVWNSLAPWCKTYMGSKSSSIEDTAVNLVWSMAFLDQVDQTAWPPSSLHDWYTHSWVVRFRLEGNLVVAYRLIYWNQSLENLCTKYQNSICPAVYVLKTDGCKLCTTSPMHWLRYDLAEMAGGPRASQCACWVYGV